MKGLLAFAMASAFAASLIGSVARAEEGRGVRTPQAVKIFDEVCGKTLPTFRDAEKRAKMLGLAFEAADPSKDLWISAFQSTDGRNGCSIRYGTVETVANLMKGLRLLGDIRPTGSLTAEVQYHGSNNIVEIRVDELRRAGRIVVQFDIEIE